jgi:hypothetical protein
MANDKKKSLLSGFKILFVIIAVLLIPMIMDQAKMNDDDVKAVGRVCGGIAGIFTLYGIITRLLRFLAIIVVALIALAVLVSENVIEAPRLMEFFS